MRVVTSNIQSGTSATGQRTDPEELARAYADVDADVIALQEVDRDQRRSGRVDQLPVIAGALGLEHTRYGAALAGDVRISRKAPASVGKHEGPAYGVALASRYPIISWFAHRLPRLAKRLPSWQRGRFAWWAHEPRVAVLAVLDAPAGPVVVASTHLSLVVPVSSWQLRVLLRKVGAMGLPALVCGDFNLGYGAVRRIATGWQMPQGLTFPADTPRQQIDHVLVRGFEVENTATLRLPISDHRALAVEVRR